MVVNIQIDSSFACYEVTHKVDGIYEAKLLRKSHHFIYNYPDKIILLRNGKEWVSDHHHKEIGLMIGRKVNQEEEDEQV